MFAIKPVIAPEWHGVLTGQLTDTGNASIAIGGCDTQLTGAQLASLIDELKDLKWQRCNLFRERSNRTPVTELVAAGMVWLDEHYPDHVTRFDPSTFHVMRNTCVLTQATGMDGWTATAEAVADRITWGDFEMLGFSVAYDDSITDFNQSRRVYEARVNELNQAWLDAYAARGVTTQHNATESIK